MSHGYDQRRSVQLGEFMYTSYSHSSSVRAILRVRTSASVCEKACLAVSASSAHRVHWSAHHRHFLCDLLCVLPFYIHRQLGKVHLCAFDEHYLHPTFIIAGPVLLRQGSHARSDCRVSPWHRESWKFTIIPALVGIISGFEKPSVRLYRTFVLEEIGQDYVRTAARARSR